MKGSVRNPDLTRRRILEAAMREFAEYGFAGARVDLIARAARINKRMLYHYFGNKEALFREVLRHKIQSRTALMGNASAHAWESLPDWFEVMRQDPQWIRLLQWEALQWGEQARVIDEARRRKNFQQAIARIREEQSQGRIPPQLDAGQLLLSVLALTAYPFAFPQLARLATGQIVSSKKFHKQRREFLGALAACLKKATDPETT